MKIKLSSAIYWTFGLALFGFWPAFPIMLGFDSGVDSSIQALPALLFFTIPAAILLAATSLMVAAFRNYGKRDDG